MLLPMQLQSSQSVHRRGCSVVVRWHSSLTTPVSLLAVRVTSVLLLLLLMVLL